MIKPLANLGIPAELIAFRTPAVLEQHLRAFPNLQTNVIGHSREGRPLLAYGLGHGKRHVAIIAGCHADEPIGPITAQLLPAVLPESFPELLETFTFHVIPQMNPDGAERNNSWFRDPLQLTLYREHVIRELPGDDIEFGFGQGPAVRPECRAAQEFLAPAGPFAAHFSLHGMGYATGAWCLVCREWIQRAQPFMDAFTRLCQSLDFPQHDEERGGGKGFHRIAPGYCTTPNSAAMRQFFIDKGDLPTAARFLPSSMEWSQSFGGDPLCIVSEIPLFLNNATGREPEPVPIALQVRLQLAMFVLALTEAL